MGGEPPVAKDRVTNRGSAGLAHHALPRLSGVSLSDAVGSRSGPGGGCAHWLCPDGDQWRGVGVRGELVPLELAMMLGEDR